MKAIAVCTLAVLAALAVGVQPARACSCIPPDPWVAVAQGDAAFVGTVLERRDSRTGTVLVLSVERRLKGPLGTLVKVRTTHSAMCGVDADVGERVGLALDRRRGEWHGSLCWQFEPQQLLAVTALPLPNGRGTPAMLVGGRFGPARMLALDARGRTLAYGAGAGRAEAFSACPGRSRVAEVGSDNGGRFVAVRTLPSLQLLWYRRLGEVGVATPRCIDARGERLAVFVSDEAARGRLVRMTPGGARTIWRGAAFYASFRGRTAYVQLLRNGTTLLAVDAWTGARHKLGSVPVNGAYQLVLNPAGTHFAGDSHTEGVGNPRLLVIDLRQRPLRLRSIPHPTVFGSVRWLGNERLLYFGGRGEILVYDTRLRRVSRSTGWHGGAPAVLGGKAYGIDGRRLVAMTLPHGLQRAVRRLPGSADVVSAAAR